MLIVIHRQRLRETQSAYISLSNTLEMRYPGKVKVLYRGRTIMVGENIQIELRNGGPEHCIGWRPNYFFTDDFGAIEYFSDHGGKELKQLSEIYDVIAKEMKGE